MHVKLDTGMGRWGVSELAAPPREVVGLVTHLATADSDLDFARRSWRFREATAGYAHLTRHAANSAATLRLPESHFDAARCGIALYGLSPFGTDAAADGLEPVLVVAQRAGARQAPARRRVDRLRPPLRRRARHVDRHRAGRLRRRLPPRPDRHRGARRRASRGRVVGTISMDAFAVELGAELAAGTPVTLVGPGLPLEAHARVAGTITYELASRMATGRDASAPGARRPGRSAPRPTGARRASGRGRAPVSIPPPAYQRGTTISRWSCSTARERPLDDERGVGRRAARRAGTGSGSAAGSRAVSTKPGLIVCTEIPRRASSIATVRENASCACFVAEYGP